MHQVFLSFVLRSVLPELASDEKVGDVLMELPRGWWVSGVLELDVAFTFLRTGVLADTGWNAGDPVLGTDETELIRELMFLVLMCWLL